MKKLLALLFARGFVFLDFPVVLSVMSLEQAMLGNQVRMSRLREMDWRIFNRRRRAVSTPVLALSGPGGQDRPGTIITKNTASVQARAILRSRVTIVSGRTWCRIHISQAAQLLSKFRRARCGGAQQGRRP